MHTHTFLGDARCNNNKNNKKNQPTNKQNNRGFCNISCIALSVSSPINVRCICTLCRWPVVLLHTHWTRRSCNFIHSCWWKPGWMFAKFTSKSVNTQKSVVLKITCMSNHTNIEHVACVQYNSLCLCMTLDGMAWHASVSLWRDARKTRCQHFSPYVYALLLLVIWYVWDALQMQPTSALTIRPSGVGFRKDELF